MMSEFVLFIIFCQILPGQTILLVRTLRDDDTSEENVQCERKVNLTSIEFFCSNKFTSNEIEIDDLNSTILESITFLRVTAEMGRKGPLKTIPSNICCLRKLQVDDRDRFHSMFCLIFSF